MLQASGQLWKGKELWIRVNMEEGKAKVSSHYFGLPDTLLLFSHTVLWLVNGIFVFLFLIFFKSELPQDG